MNRESLVPGLEPDPSCEIELALTRDPQHLLSTLGLELRASTTVPDFERPAICRVLPTGASMCEASNYIIATISSTHKWKRDEASLLDYLSPVTKLYNTHL